MWVRFLDAAENEPLTLIGFLGAAIVWSLGSWGQRKRRKQQTIELIADRLSRAQYIADRVRSKQTLIYDRIEEKMGTQKESKERHEIILGGVEKLYADIEKVNRYDASDKNVNHVKEILAIAIRMDGQADDTIGLTRGNDPTTRS